MAPDKRDELYNNLINSGRVTENEIGTIDDFKAAIDNETHARLFYNNLRKSGIFSVDEIGEENDFVGSIADDFAQPATPTAQPTATAQQPRKTRYDVAQEQYEQGRQQTNATPISQTAMGSVGGYGISPMGMPVRNTQGYPQANPQPQAPAKPMAPAPRAGQWSGAPMQQTPYAPTEEKGNKSFMPIEQETDTKARYDAAKQAVGGQGGQVQSLRESIISDIEGEQAKVQRAYNPTTRMYTDTEGNPMGIATDNMEDMATTNSRMMDLQAAKRSLDNAQKMIDEANAGNKNFFASAGRGMRDKMFDPSTWDFGVTDLTDQAAIMRALEAYDNGEQLTDSQRKLLDAKAVELATTAYFGSELGRGYKAGQVTAEAIPFMLEMAINPAAGVGKGASKAMVRYALKKFGKEAIEKGGKRYIAKQAMKYGTRIAGDVVGAGTMAATTGAARTAADALDRMAGNLHYGTDEQGNITFDGHTDAESWVKAFGKAFASTTIENYSEMLGNYFGPALGLLGKGASKVGKGIARTKAGAAVGRGIDKIGGAIETAYNSTLSKKIGLQAVGDFISKVPAGKVAGFLSELEKRAQWHGVMGEYAEEVAGGILNALVVGDQTLDTDKDTGVFNLDNNIDTFLGVALMGGFFSGAKTVGYGVERAHNARQYNKANRMGAAAFGDGWADVQAAIESDPKAGAVAVLADPNSTKEQREAALRYAAAVTAQHGMEQGKAKRDAEGVQTPQEAAAEQSYNTGYDDATTDELRSDLNLAYTDARQTLVGLIGEDAVNDIDSDPLAMQAQYDQDMTVDDNTKYAIASYVSAKSAWDGVQQRISDDAADRADQRRAEGERMAYKGKGDMQGMLRPLTINEDSSERDPETGERKKKTVYLVNGTIAVEPNGSGLSREGTDKTIYVYDPETGEAHELDPFGGAGVLSVGDVVSMEDYLADNEQQSQAEVQQAAETAQGKVKKNTPFETPQGRKGVVQSIEGDNAIVLFADGGMEQASMPLAEVQQYADALRRKEYEARHPQETPAEQPQQPNTATVGQAPTATAETPQEGGNATTEQPKVEYPRDKQGNIDYDKIGDATTFATALGEEFGEDAPATLDNIIAEETAKMKKQNAVGKARIRKRLAMLEKAKAQLTPTEEAPVEAPTAEVEQPTAQTPQAGEVPDMSVDKASDARARGYRMQSGVRYDRQGATEGVVGSETEVKFTNKEKPIKGRWKVVEAGSVQPSHIGGQNNPLHFITEAQPKDRTDRVSDAESEKIAANINPKEIIDGVTAYTGAPVVNGRGEVIQGNNRATALRKMGGYAESAARYKQYLIDHAADYGLNAEDIAKMQNPVMVREVDVTDEEAIRLGQFTASDTESGGKERISADKVLGKLTDEQTASVLNIMLRGGEETDETLMQLIDRNGADVLTYLAGQGAINDTQVQSAYGRDGRMTPEAKNDLADLVTQNIFKGGADNIKKVWNEYLPVAAQKALLQAMAGDMMLPVEDRLIKEVRNAIMAVGEIKNNPFTKEAKTAEEYHKGLDMDARQADMLSRPIKERYSELEIDMAVRFLTTKQNALKAIFGEYQRYVTGTNSNLFEEAQKMNRAEAIEKTFGIKENNQQNVTGKETETLENGGGERGTELGHGERPSKGESGGAAAGQPGTAGQAQQPEVSKYEEAESAFFGFLEWTNWEYGTNYDWNSLTSFLNWANKKAKAKNQPLRTFVREWIGDKYPPKDAAELTDKIFAALKEQEEAKKATAQTPKEEAEGVTETAPQPVGGATAQTETPAAGQSEGTAEGEERDYNKPLKSLAEVKRFMEEIGYNGSLSKTMTAKDGRKFVKYEASGTITPNIYFGETTPRDILQQFHLYDNIMGVNIPADIEAEFEQEDADRKESKKKYWANEREKAKDILTQANIPFMDVIDSERGIRVVFTERTNERGNYMDWMDLSDIEQLQEDIEGVRNRAKTIISARIHEEEKTIAECHKGLESNEPQEVQKHAYYRDEITFAEQRLAEYKGQLEKLTAPKQETKPLTNNEKNWREVVEVGVAQYSHVIADNVERSGFEFADEIRKAYDTSNPRAKAIVQAIEQHISSIKVRPDGSTQYKISEETLEREEQSKQEPKLTDNEQATQTKKETKAERDKRLLEERKQRILAKGLIFDKPFGLISVSETMSVEDIDTNIARIIEGLKENEGSGKFEGFAYQGKYAENAGHQIDGYINGLTDVVPNEILKAWAESHRLATYEDIIEYGKKLYNAAKQEQPRAAVGEGESNEPEKGGKGEKVKNEAAPKERIDDVGEKIGGARKDLAQKMGAKINLDADTFPKMFPKFDLKKAVEQGLDPKLASSVYFLRIAAQKEYKSWLKHSTKGKALSAAKFFAAYAKQFLENGNTSTEFKDNRWTFTEYGKKHIEYNLALYEKVYERFGNALFDLDLTGYEIKPVEKNEWSHYYRKNEQGKEEEYQPAYEARSVYSSKYYVEGELDKAIDELVNRMAESVSYNESHPYRLSHYYIPGEANSHYIGVKLGGKVVALTEKMSDKEASQYLREHEAELQEKAKRLDEERKQNKQGGTNTKWKPELGLGGGRARVGNDYRNGKDVSAEDFRKTFGFRGVEFGNYVTQAERQRFLNEAYDAMMDLAALLNVSPRALSLGGQLGFAIGARGGGSAMAHYEPDLNVINLTKSKGAGSLAHEWWHALDYYFNSMGDRRKTPATANKRAEDFNPGHRAEMANAFVSLMEKINGSDYRKRSVALDAVLNKDYYTNPTELGARAFQDYVQRRLTDRGQVNDFLSSFTPEEQWNGKAETYPYPTGKDADAIDERFDKLFGTMLEREDEQGNVMLYERVDGKAAKVSAKERKLRDAIVDLLRKAGIDVVTESEEGQRVLDMANGRARQHRVYHGSGADFERFDHSHMGEGEGAQAFGWGTYVTEVEGIGRTYAEKTSGGWMYKGKNEQWYVDHMRDNIKEGRYNSDETIIANVLSRTITESIKDSIRNTIKQIEDYVNEYKDSKNQDDIEYRKELEADLSFANSLKEEDFHKPNRVLYTVEIPEDNGSNYIDWTKKPGIRAIRRLVAQMNDKQKERIASIPVRRNHDGEEFISKDNIAERILWHINNSGWNNLYDVAEIANGGKYVGNEKSIAKLLNAAGFVGIKYPAEYYSGGRSDGAKNYVIFNEGDLQITDKVRFFRTESGEAYGFTMGGKIYLDPKIATAETPVHEYTHLWAAALRAANPKAWEQLKSELEKDKDLMAYVQRLYPELKGDELMDEVFAHFSGRRGAERLRAEQERMEGETRSIVGKAKVIAMFENLRNALKKFWNMARDLFAGKTRGVEKLSAEDFADMALADLVGGFKPDRGNRVDREDRERDADYQERITAGQELKDEVNASGHRASFNADYTINLVHGTSPEAAEKIKSEGLQKGSYLAPSRNEANTHVSAKRKDNTFLTIRVDARDISYNGATNEYYAEDGLVMGEDGVWVSPQRKAARQADSDERFRVEEEPVFYSNAMRAVENIKQERATPEQWVKMIEKQGGMKAGEDKWLGLSEWLKGSDAKTLTKGEVLDYIRANEIQVEEVEYGMDEYIADKVRDRWDSIIKEAERKLKNDGYNENEIGELDEGVWNNAIDKVIDDWFGKGWSQKIYYTLDGGVGLAENHPQPINSTRLRYTTEGLDNKREIVLTVPTIEPWNEHDEVHFGEAGGGRAVAWVRFGETTDADGKRVLVIDEIQSKRHQEGREKGYKSDKENLFSKYKEELAKKYGKYFIGMDLTPEEFAKYRELEDEYTKEENERLTAIPDAPFEKNWHEVAMKRMLRFAAENGYDKVAWTKGEQQAERYDLSTLIDHIDVYPHADEMTGKRVSGEYTVIPVDKSGNYMIASTEHPFSGNLTADEVLQYYGKDLGTRMMQAADKAGNDEKSTIEGEGLRIGGEGMKGFYDQILPRFMDKYGKKWGVKTGEVELPNIGENGLTMWSVDVTDDMRESVMRGQPLFRPKTQSREGGEEAAQGDWYDRGSVERIGEFAGYSPKRIAAMNARQEESARKQFNDAAEKLHLSDNITFADSIDDVQGLTDKERREWRRKKGWYSPRTGKIVIILGNHKSMDDVMKSILHEGVAHHGLRQMFGEHFNTFLDNVYRVASPEIRERIYAMAKKHGWDFRTATEEYLATLAEDTDFERPENQSWWRQVKEWFIDLLHKIGFKLHDAYDTITDNELRYVLWRSYQNLMNPGRFNSVVEEAKDIAKQYDLKVGQWDETWTIAAEEEPNATIEYGGRRIPIWATNGRRENRADRVERNDSTERDKDYEKLKKKYPEHMIVKREGDFYLIEGEDAKKAANLLGEVLVKHKGIDAIGFPTYMIDEYLPKLVGAGVRVAVADNVAADGVAEDAAEYAQRDAEYMEAVNSGDMEKAQRMVDEAAKRAMPDTKVVDENGNPLVVYHGTPNAYSFGNVYTGAKPFTVFNENERGKNTMAQDAKFGFFFTPDERFASYFRTRREYDPITRITKESGYSTSNLYAVFLNMRNPLDLRNLSNEEAEIVRSMLPKYAQQNFDVDDVKRMSRTKNGSKELQFHLVRNIDAIKANGYDGIINYVEDNAKRKNVEYEAFNPSQIKSADPVTYDDNGNVVPLSQRFNEGSDDIRFRDGEDEEDNERESIEQLANNMSIGTAARFAAIAARNAQESHDNAEALAAALNFTSQNLAEIVKATKAQKKFDKATVKQVTDMARVMVSAGYLDSMGRADVKGLLKAIRESTGETDNTDNVNRIIDIMVKNQLKNQENTLATLLKIKGSRVDARGINVQGKLDPNGQQVIKSFKDNMKEQRETIESRIADAEERMTSEDSSVADAAYNEKVGLQLALDYVEKIEQSKADEKDIEAKKRAELSKVYDYTRVVDVDEQGNVLFKKDGTERTHEVRHVRAEYKGKISDEKKAERERVEQTAAAMDDAIRHMRMERIDAYTDFIAQVAGNMKESMRKLEERREAEKRRIEEIHHNANSDMEGRPASEHRSDTGGVLNWINNTAGGTLFAPLASFGEMLRMFGRKSPNGEGYLFNRFMRGLIDARHKEIKGVHDKYSELDKKAQAVFGGKVETWADMMNEVRKGENIAVEWFDGKEMKPHTLHQGNLMYIYMVNKMSDGRMKLRHMGIDEKAMAVIESKLDPRLKEIADWLQDDFLVRSRNEYNETHKRMFGASMSAIEDYFPLVINSGSRNKDAEKEDAAENNPNTITTATGAIKKRTVNVVDLDLLNADAMHVILDHIAEMEHWNAFAEYNRDLNTLRSYKRFENQVKNMTTILGDGEQTWKAFNKTAQIAVGSYQKAQSDLDAKSLEFASKVTAAKVAFRINTALKQLLSLPAYLPYANASGFYHALANDLGNGTAPWKWCMENLPMYRERWESRVSGDPRLVKLTNDWNNKRHTTLRKIARAGMLPNAAVDALTVSIGAHAVYETRKAQYLKEGYSEAAAEKRAIQDAEIAYNETQQSSEGGFVSVMQVDKSWLNVLFTIFRNASMAYQRQLHGALRNLINMRTKARREQAKEFLAKQIARDGVNEAQARLAAEKRFNRAMRKNWIAVATFGYIVQLAWNFGGQMWYLLFGDDDDKKKKTWKDILIHSLFGGVEGLTGGDWLSELGRQIATGDRNPQSLNKDMPLTSDMFAIIEKFGQSREWEAVSDIINLVAQAGFGANPQTLTDIVVATIDACNGDLGLAREAGLWAMRVIQVPQSQTEQIYFDEIEMTGEEARKLSYEQLVERYAKYRVKRNYFWTFWEWDNEKALEKGEKRGERIIKERMETMSDEQLEEALSNLFESSGEKGKKLSFNQYAKREGLKGYDYSDVTKNDGAKYYMNIATWRDVAEDITLHQETKRLEDEIKRLKKLGVRENEAVYWQTDDKLKDLNKVKKEIGEMKKEMVDANGNPMSEEIINSRMESIRTARRRALYPEQAASPTDNVEE